MTTPTPVRAGDIVEVHFLGKFEDGTVFADSHAGDAVSFVAGGEEVVPGIGHAVLGMLAGESKTVRLEPGDAYGEHREGLAQTVAIADLPEGVQVGDQLSAQVGEQAVPMWVTHVDENEAIVDGNHPLAGKDVIFEILIAGVTPKID